MGDTSTPQFRRAVVALSGGRTDRQIVSLAADSAKAGHAELLGVHVVEIDWTLPLDADVAGRVEGAQRVLDIAEATAEAATYRLEHGPAPGARRRARRSSTRPPSATPT